jgi:hypothetical protein
MKKEVIKCDENYHKIKQIEIGEIKNNFYLKFYFSEPSNMQDFRFYLRARLVIWTNDVEEQIEFRELASIAEDSLDIAVVGNIKQAIKFFRFDELFPTNVTDVLDDVEENEVQAILKKSEKCNTFLSTVPVSKYVNPSFFLLEESKSKKDKRLNVMDSMKNFFSNKI